VTGYPATVRHAGRGWSVVVAGVVGPGGVQVRDLADVEPRVRKHIANITGTDPADIELDVDVRLPPAVQIQLDLIESLSKDVDDEVRHAVAALRELGLSRSDVGRVIALFCKPPRPLTTSNRELADHGLDRHPDAIGVEWDDHGFALTRKCRRHLDLTRSSYLQLPPDALNALVHAEPEEFLCDFCHEGDDDA
jgi:hypothetical protein